MNWIKKSIIISILLVASISTIAAQQDSADRSDGSVLKWQKLADGLELGVFLSPQRADSADKAKRISSARATHLSLADSSVNTPSLKQCL